MNTIIENTPLRPAPNYPTYPPYHTGYYIEDFFYNFYKNNCTSLEIKKQYIPIFWTSCYINNNFLSNRSSCNFIQEYLDTLDSNKEYFTIVQFDDGVLHNLPTNTTIFEAGGNGNGIPIPLVCSPIPENLVRDNICKTFFCSFVGSITNTIRSNIIDLYGRDSDFYFSTQDWNPSVEINRLQHFVDITQASVFTLCPRGYGAQSFRLYEAFQLNSIPVIVYDKQWLPFNDKLNWNEFSVLIHSTKIHLIKQKLKSYSNEQIQDMLVKGKKIYNEYFTQLSVCNQIINILKENE
jgi:hypothetical protein